MVSGTCARPSLTSSVPWVPADDASNQSWGDTHPRPINNRCAGSGRAPCPGHHTDEVIPIPFQPSPSLHAPSLDHGSTPAVIHHTVPQQLPSTKVLKRVPRASRLPAATKLASILDGIVKGNDDGSWDRLFRFCSRCLRVPKRGGHRRSLAEEVNQLISEEANPPPPTRPGKQGSRPAHYPLNSLAAWVSCKLEEGDFRGAVRLICSEDFIAELDEATLAALRSKHPPPHPNSCIPPVPEEFAPSHPGIRGGNCPCD